MSRNAHFDWTGPRHRLSASRRGASTLIELLIVMAMIGLLITMLIPSLKRSMDLARAAVCQHNLREIGQSLTMYRIEHDGWLPMAEPVAGVAASGRENTAWFAQLHPTYLPDPVVLTCPMDPFAYRMVQSRTSVRDAAVADYPSYGMNSFIMSAGGGFLANVDRYQPRRPLDTILVADLGPDVVRYGQFSQSGNGPARNRSLMMWGDGLDPFSGIAANPWVTTRHNHGINVLTLAGGVRNVKTSGLLNSPIRRFYDNCAAGGCTLCNDLTLFHYSFAKKNLFWWTGRTPSK